MVVRACVVFLLMIVLTGCASSQQKATISQLQTQVVDLERQLTEKDDEIADLRDEMDQLSIDVRKKEKTMMDEAMKASTVSKKDRGIIRVDVSTGQVQIALKKAGYYNGAIDSKIGENTKRAIAQFQKDNGLHSDGVIGQKTWEKLKTFLEEE